MTLQIAKQALLPRLARTYTPRVLLVSRYTCCACTVTPLPNRVRTSNPRAVISPKRPSYPPPSRRLRSRQFSTTNNPPLLKISSKNLPPRPKPPPEHEIEESFLKGSGPGGQKINKTNSAVQLKHIPTGIVVKSQATRSRSQNRTIARQLLADKLDDIARGDESRAAVVGQVKRKKRASSAKKSRRKYRKLEDAKAGQILDQEEDLHDRDYDEESFDEEETDVDGNDKDKEMLNKR